MEALSFFYVIYLDVLFSVQDILKNHVLNRHIKLKLLYMEITMIFLKRPKYIVEFTPSSRPNLVFSFILSFYFIDKLSSNKL